MILDTLVKCSTCDKEERVNFGECLGKGWPKCCGYTMTLITTKANMEEAIKPLFNQAESLIKSIKKARKKWEYFYLLYSV